MEGTLAELIVFAVFAGVFYLVLTPLRRRLEKKLSDWLWKRSSHKREKPIIDINAYRTKENDKPKERDN